MSPWTTPRLKEADRIPPPERASPNNSLSTLGPCSAASAGISRGSPTSDRLRRTSSSSAGKTSSRNWLVGFSLGMVSWFLRVQSGRADSSEVYWAGGGRMSNGMLGFLRTNSPVLDCRECQRDRVLFLRPDRINTRNSDRLI